MTTARALRSAFAIAAAAAVAHALTLSRYGFYRDELYFLACAKRLAWGYVDQPPLMPILGSIAGHFGNSIVALRLPALMAAAGAIIVAAIVARHFGAGERGCTLTAAAVALMPGSLFLGNTLTTTSLEPLTWTLIVLCALQLRLKWSAPWFALLVASCTVSAYAKYSVFLLLFGLIAAAVILHERRTAITLAGAAVLSLLFLLPNIVWQAQHQFPILDVLHGDLVGRHAFASGLQPEFSNPLINAPLFLLEQLLFAGLFSSPLWIAGLRRSSFLMVSYATLIAASLVLAAKGYYVIGVYPALFAAGGAAVERWSSNARKGLAIAIVSGGVALAPLTLPVLPANVHSPNPLLADEFGWRELTATVAQSYAAHGRGLPLFADTYGVAAALEFYGRQFALPQPISSQNQYYVWGTRGQNLSSIVAVGASQYRQLRRLYRRVDRIGLFRDDRRAAAEGPTPIYLCSDPIVSEQYIWHALRWYGA